MGGEDQFQPSAGREGVGGRVAGVRDPDARDSVGSGPRASGFPPPQATLARARVGRGALLLRRPASLNSVRGLPPLHRAMAVCILRPPNLMHLILSTARTQDAVIHQQRHQVSACVRHVGGNVVGGHG